MGTVWRVYGVPYRRRTHIELMVRGRYADCIRRHPELVGHAMRMLSATLVRNAPVDTGQLRASVRVETGYQRPRVSLGPEPYNRQALKAALAGRVYRQRVRRPKLARYYALPANTRSVSSPPGWIERSIQETAREFIRLCRQFETADEQAAEAERAIEDIGGGRPRRSMLGATGGLRGALLRARR